MFVAVDIGNTNTVFGFFIKDELVFKASMKTDINMTDDEITVFLWTILTQKQMRIEDIQEAIISCVVPLMMNAQLRFFRKMGVEPQIISSKNNVVKVVGRDADNLGSDLIANAIAATHLIDCDSIILDCGTTTTFSLLEHKANYYNYLGVIIAPGFNAFSQCMTQNAAKLPVINFQKTDKALCLNTEDAMNAGVQFGFIGMVEKTISVMKNEYDKPLKVVATGGLSTFIASLTDMIDILEPNLTLLGIKYFYSLK